MKVKKAKKVTIDDLALMMARGFDELREDLGGQIAAVDKKLSGQIDAVEKNLGGRIDAVDGKVSSLREEFEAFREEVRVEFKSLHFEIDQIKHRLDKIEKNNVEEIELISGDIVVLKSKVKELELKVKKLKMAS